ncbi:hypothetical protein HOE04_03835 [archaeon]|jgi:hypothetical protein|nr:hypothetical protein [archaeon]
MVKVNLDFVLVHMLRVRDFVSVKDLKEMGRKIEAIDDSLAAYFDHYETSALIEDQSTRFSRPEIGSKYSGYWDCGFVRSPGSEELFSDEAIWYFDLGSFQSGCLEKFDEEKNKRLRREIVDLIEPGLLESGYNPSVRCLGANGFERIYAF